MNPAEIRNEIKKLKAQTDQKIAELMAFLAYAESGFQIGDELTSTLDQNQTFKVTGARSTGKGDEKESVLVGVMTNTNQTIKESDFKHWRKAK